MSEKIGFEINLETGEVSEYEVTDKQLKSAVAADKLLLAKEAARTSAFAKLAELGLTEEEIAAL